MKKSLALALTLIMVMGCMSFAAAAGDRMVTGMTGSSSIRSTYKITESTEANRASVQLTYFAGDSAWQTDLDNNQYISVQAKLAAPKADARFVQLLRSDGEKIGDLVHLGDSISYYEYSYRFDKGRDTFQNLKLKWYDKNDDSKNLLYTDDFTCTLVLTSAKPADAERITVSGAKVSDGSVAFDAAPAGETTITVFRPNDYASSYTVSTDGAEGNSTAGESAGITVSGLSAGSSKTYTIKWYSGEGDDKFLVGTDTLTVSVLPEGYYRFTPYDTPVVIEKSDGTQANITPEDGFLTSNSVELNYNLTKEQWEEVFYKYGEDNRIFLPLWFYLPGSAEDYFKIENFGNESRPVDEDLNFLKGVQYFDVGLNDGEGDYGGYKSFHEGLVIAQVKYEGNNVIIEPQSGKVSWLIKWLDNDGNDHFHRVTFDVNVSFSGQGIKLTNASPANDRVKFDTQAGANGSYSDGTVRYMLADDFGYNTNGKTFTKLVRPSDNAVSATVNGKNVNISETDNAIQLTVDARNDRSMTEAFTVCWLDEYGNTIKTERITISNCPTGAGVPWQKHWAPIGSGSINVQDRDLISFFSYDNDGKLLFKVTEKNAGALNADKVDELSKNELICEITPPEGAVKFRMSGQHSPLYDTYFADSTKQWLDSTELKDLEKEENGELKPYYCFFDELFNRTKVEGVYVYTVNNTEVTFADIVIFQWYDKDEKLIEVNGKDGECFYLIKEPYVKTTTTAALTKDPTEAVAKPTIVISNSATGKVVTNGVLKTEMPLQNAVDPNSDTRYLYMKLTYIDENTGLEVEPGTEGAVVYLAYPDGMTYEQAQGYTFKLYHYTDENHVTHEEMELEATPYGLRFKTTSFSPFLLEWTPAASSPSHNESGGLSGVNITNLTNREISSYRLGGGLFSFRLGGSGAVTVTADGMVVTPDADGWYTVPANARIVVDNSVMALPKTGDMPVWRWLPGL